MITIYARWKAIVIQGLLLEKLQKSTNRKNQSGTKRIPPNLPPMCFFDTEDQLQLIS